MYVMGVDCGGTKTEAVAYDEQKQVVGRVVMPFGNLVVAYEQALFNIKTAVEQLFNQLGKKECQRVVLGIAGIDAGGLKAKVSSDLANWQVPFFILNDAQLAHYALLKGAKGAIVIAGTGSVALGREEDSWYRVGGWGHLFGDEGSAYAIAKQAILLALADFDNGAPTSVLTKACFAFFDVSDVFGLTRKSYQLTKGEIAQLAIVVAKLAATDPQALVILQNAGTDLAKMLLQLVAKMPAETCLKVGLNGAVIEKNQIVQTAFKKYLAENSSQMFELLNKESSNAIAAVYFKPSDFK